MVPWLRLCTSTAGGVGSIPDPGSRIPHPCGLAKKSLVLVYAKFLRSFSNVKGHLKLNPNSEDTTIKSSL